MRVFFVRSKPYGIDAVELARDNRLVFIGYPLLRPDTEYTSESLASCITSLNADETEWQAAKSQVPKNYARQAQANRNLAAEVGPGDIALLPHAAEGVVYAGVVTTGFELIDQPPWLDDFLNLLPPEEQRKAPDERWHAAEVAQVCRVDRFIPIAISELGQFRASLFGRSRFGRVLDAHATIKALMRGERRSRNWTVDREEVLARLRNDLTPTDFEYLIVSLLQLEHQSEVWQVVAGSGDGGVDGVATDGDGRPTAVLQCKLRYGGERLFFQPKGRLRQGIGYLRRYVAALSHPATGSQDTGVTFMGAERIAQLVIDHHRSLPIALTLRVGEAR